jgi:hypothetical protein
MNEESALHKFKNTCTKIPTEGIASYDIKLDLVKKKNPVYSQSNSKQHTIFDDGKLT